MDLIGEDIWSYHGMEDSSVIEQIFIVVFGVLIIILLILLVVKISVPLLGFAVKSAVFVGKHALISAGLRMVESAVGEETVSKVLTVVRGVKSARLVMMRSRSAVRWVGERERQIVEGGRGVIRWVERSGRKIGKVEIVDYVFSEETGRAVMRLGGKIAEGGKVVSVKAGRFVVSSGKERAKEAVKTKIEEGIDVISGKKK